MCNIKRQHITFKQELNKIDSNHSKDYPAAFIDDFLYEAALDYVDIFSGANKTKAGKYGFEVTQMRIDMLSTLVVDLALSDSDPLTPINQTTENGFYKHEFKLPDDYMHKVRFYGIHDSCGNISVDIIQHHDLDSKLYDSYQKPSIKWTRLLGVIKKSTQTGKSLFVYSDEELLGINGQYIKIPIKPFFGGYDTLEFSEGDPSFPSSSDPSINMDIPDNYCSLVVDIAVQNVSGNFADYNQVAYRQQKIINTV